jgi:aspartate beta-hydroxylase
VCTAGARCPATAAAIAAQPAFNTMIYGSHFFSRLEPHTHLAAHCGPSNLRLRVHLGLLVPEGCRIRVGDETRAWSEGECMVFDDSIEHEVRHGPHLTHRGPHLT